MFYLAGKFRLLYGISLECWLLIMVGFLLLWSVLMLLFGRGGAVEQRWEPEMLQRSLRRERTALALNLILMLVGLVIIFLVTFVRRESSKHEVILIPLRVLFGLKAPNDYWHVTVMNIVMYVPFACGLCIVIGNKNAHPAVMTVLVCFALAVVAEVLQYVLGSGLAEVDDVLMNTFGAFLGTLPYVVTSNMIHNSLSKKSRTPGAAID